MSYRAARRGLRAIGIAARHHWRASDWAGSVRYRATCHGLRATAIAARHHWRAPDWAGSVRYRATCHGLRATAIAARWTGEGNPRRVSHDPLPRGRLECRTAPRAAAFRRPASQRGGRGRVIRGGSVMTRCRVGASNVVPRHARRPSGDRHRSAPSPARPGLGSPRDAPRAAAFRRPASQRGGRGRGNPRRVSHDPLPRGRLERRTTPRATAFGRPASQRAITGAPRIGRSARYRATRRGLLATGIPARWTGGG
jgi:hypothetical protein